MITYNTTKDRKIEKEAEVCGRRQEQEKGKVAKATYDARDASQGKPHSDVMNKMKVMEPSFFQQHKYVWLCA